MVANPLLYRNHVDEVYEKHPELFPEGFSEGYKLHDLQRKKKQNGFLVRRVKLKNGKVYEIMPSFVMPYLVGKTEEVSKGLLLRKWAVPYEVIASILGRDAMYWERVESSLSRFSIVGSLCKTASVPEHLAADEKITFWNGEEVYIAMTAGKGCVLGAELSMSENTEGLETAYGVFKTESLLCEADYTVHSVNLDGWKATHQSWRNLFPKVSIILCFLHAFLKVRDLGKSLKELYWDVCSQVWEVYRKGDKSSFLSSIVDLEKWAESNLKDAEKVLMKVKDICFKSAQFALAYDIPNCYRTSNQIDRPMNMIDRYLYSIRYFKGHRQSANDKIRAWAMIYNFSHFGQRTLNRPNTSKKSCRFEELNGFVYNSNWLENLIIAGSMNGRKTRHRKS